MRTLFFMGRALFGGFFLFNGLAHLGVNPPVRPSGLPRARSAAELTTGAVFSAAGISVLAGLGPRYGLAALVAVLAPATLAHRFWEEPDDRAYTRELVEFSKNLALVGAALALMRVREPWPGGLDARRAARGEEMFIRLGGREMRSLPT